MRRIDARSAFPSTVELIAAHAAVRIDTAPHAIIRYAAVNDGSGITAASSPQTKNTPSATYIVRFSAFCFFVRSAALSCAPALFGLANGFFAISLFHLFPFC